MEGLFRPPQIQSVRVLYPLFQLILPAQEFRAYLIKLQVRRRLRLFSDALNRIRAGASSFRIGSALERGVGERTVALEAPRSCGRDCRVDLRDKYQPGRLVQVIEASRHRPASRLGPPVELRTTQPGHQSGAVLSDREQLIPVPFEFRNHGAIIGRNATSPTMMMASVARRPRFLHRWAGKFSSAHGLAVDRRMKLDRNGKVLGAIAEPHLMSKVCFPTVTSAPDLAAPALASIGHDAEHHARLQHVFGQIAELHSRRRCQNDDERCAVYLERHRRGRVIELDLL